MLFWRSTCRTRIMLSSIICAHRQRRNSLVWRLRLTKTFSSPLRSRQFRIGMHRLSSRRPTESNRKRNGAFASCAPRLNFRKQLSSKVRQRYRTMSQWNKLKTNRTKIFKSRQSSPLRASCRRLKRLQRVSVRHSTSLKRASSITIMRECQMLTRNLSRPCCARLQLWHVAQRRIRT